MSKSIAVTIHQKVTFEVQDLLNILNVRMRECHDYLPTDVVSFAVRNAGNQFITPDQIVCPMPQAVKLTMKDGLSFMVSLASVKSAVSSETTTEALEEQSVRNTFQIFHHQKVVSTSTDGTGSFE
jgi:hypothetical protein